MNIAILVAVIEIISILIKQFLPKYTKLIPVANTAIALGASLFFKMDYMTALCTEGISMAAYDLVYGIYKLITGKDNKDEIEEKGE